MKIAKHVTGLLLTIMLLISGITAHADVRQKFPLPLGSKVGHSVLASMLEASRADCYYQIQSKTSEVSFSVENIAGTAKGKFIHFKGGIALQPDADCFPRFFPRSSLNTFKYKRVRNMMIEIMNNSFEIPRNIKEYVQITLDQCQSVESLVPLIQHIYVDLQRSQVFNDLVEAVRHFIPNEERPVFHQALAENDQYRLSLIGIHRFFPIPVHDHPHMMGVQFVVHGRLQVRSYQLLETVREPSLVNLECLSDNIMRAGSTSTIEKASCNLHGLQSMNITAVCLALQAPPCIAHKQAWYFPTHPLVDHTQVITWNRVIKSPGKFDAHHNQQPQAELEGIGS